MLCHPRDSDPRRNRQFADRHTPRSETHKDVASGGVRESCECLVKRYLVNHVVQFCTTVAAGQWSTRYSFDPGSFSALSTDCALCARANGRPGMLSVKHRTSGGWRAMTGEHVWVKGF
jgi:hypothetical protein